jgi:hypothetical protein
LVNFLEIGFVVDGQKLYELTTFSETLNGKLPVMEDRGISKSGDDKKIDLANRLRTLVHQTVKDRDYKKLV